MMTKLFNNNADFSGQCFSEEPKSGAKNNYFLNIKVNYFLLSRQIHSTVLVYLIFKKL